MIRNKQLLKKKEQGYALIIVLFVITVFSVLGLTVISVSFNNTKQFSKETTQTQALNVAEMGLKAYNKELEANREKVSVVTEANFQQILRDNVLPESLNSSSDSSLSSMQGSPSYTVTHGEVSGPIDNKITVNITSKGTSGGDTQTITQTKTFKYQVVSSGNTGDPNYTPEYMGLKLPYMDGGLILGTSNTDYLIHPKNYNESERYNIYIEPNEEKCIGAVLTKNVDNFDTTFSDIKSRFQNALSVPPNIPSEPNKWTIDNADTSTWWETNGDVSAKSKVGNHYTDNINFSKGINIDDPNGTVFEKNVSINGYSTTSVKTEFHGDVYINGPFMVNSETTIDGNLYVNGSLNVNSDLTVNGNVYSKNAFNIYKGTTIIGDSNSNTNNTGNVYVGDSTQVFDPAEAAYVNGNFYTKNALNISSPTTFGYKDTDGKPHNGNLYSGGALTINSPATFNGNVYVDNWAALNFYARCLVEGNVYSSDYIGITKSTIFNGYVFSNRLNSQYNDINEPAPQFNKTVYIESQTDSSQGSVSSTVNGLKRMEYNQGAVIKGSAHYSTTGNGEIYFGLQQHGGDNSSGSGGSSGNSGQSPITIVDTKTNYQ